MPENRDAQIWQRDRTRHHACAAVAHRIDDRDGALVLRLGEPGDVGRVLAECQAAGCEIEDLEVGRADLEDVFLQQMAERAESERLPALATA